MSKNGTTKIQSFTIQISPETQISYEMVVHVIFENQLKHSVEVNLIYWEKIKSFL